MPIPSVTKCGSFFIIKVSMANAVCFNSSPFSVFKFHFESWYCSANVTLSGDKKAESHPPPSPLPPPV